MTIYYSGRKLRIGESCAVDDRCDDPNAKCTDSKEGVCACLPGYFEERGSCRKCSGSMPRHSTDDRLQLSNAICKDLFQYTYNDIEIQTHNDQLSIQRK